MSYNLEPIEDADSDLAKHFGREDSPDHASPESNTEHQQEILPRVEGRLEKSASEKDLTYQKILSDVSAAQHSDDVAAQVSQDASEAHQKIDYESQLTHLVDLAMTQGVEHAVQVAEHLNDYYMLDQLHDRLLHDDLHQKLVERGMIRNE